MGFWIQCVIRIGLFAIRDWPNEALRPIRYACVLVVCSQPVLERGFEVSACLVYWLAMMDCALHWEGKTGLNQALIGERAWTLLDSRKGLVFSGMSLSHLVSAHRLCVTSFDVDRTTGFQASALHMPTCFH